MESPRTDPDDFIEWDVAHLDRANPVPERVILRLAEKLEPPTLAEAHGVVMGSRTKGPSISPRSPQD